MNTPEDIKKFGRTDILMLVCIVFWAVNFSFIKIALREFSPNAFNAIRLMMASVILLIILGISGEGISLRKQDLGIIVVIGIVGNTFYQMLFIHGINLTTASNTSLILAMTPIFIALLSSLLKHERIPAAGWAGIFMSFIGLYLVIGGQGGFFEFSSKNLRGDLMIFSGDVLWAFYTVFSKPLLERISPLKLTALTMAVGSVFYFVVSIKDVLRIPWREVSFTAWAYLSYSALFALVFGYVIWYSSVRRIGNSKTAIYGNITPVLTVFFAYIFLSEMLTWLQIGGALVILLGVYLTRSGSRFFKKYKASAHPG